MSAEMSAAEYRELVAAEDGPHEMSAEQYREFVNQSVKLGVINTATAKTLVDRHSSGANTEPKAMTDFMAWLGLVSPHPVRREFRFDPDRRWRFDFAVPELMLAFEYDGMNNPDPAKVSAHGSNTGMIRDAAKINSAALLGWLVIRVNAKSLREGDGYADAMGAFHTRGIEL